MKLPSLIVFIFLVFSANSCKSDFRCVCTYQDGTTEIVQSFYNIQKNYAKAECGVLESSFQQQNPGSDCKIEKID